MEMGADPPFLSVFEMLVERLSNVERTTAGLVRHEKGKLAYRERGAEFDGTLLRSGTAHEGVPLHVVKDYDKPLTPGGIIIVNGPFFEDGSPWCETLEWCAGAVYSAATAWMDDSVTRVLGADVVAEVKRSCAELLEADREESVKCADVGLAGHTDHLYLSGAWCELAAKEREKWLVALSVYDYGIVLRCPTDGELSAAALLEGAVHATDRIVAMFGLPVTREIEIRRPDYTALDVAHVRDGDEGVDAAWSKMSGKQRDEFRKFARRNRSLQFRFHECLTDDV
jgi:hypothetical protein